MKQDKDQLMFWRVVAWSLLIAFIYMLWTYELEPIFYPDPQPVDIQYWDWSEMGRV